jgi:hypothetical protein
MSYGPTDEEFRARIARFNQEEGRAPATARRPFPTAEPTPLAPTAEVRSLYTGERLDNRPPLEDAFTFLGDTPASPPPELIKRLIPANGVVILGGQSSAGKTFTAIHMAKCLATGLPFFERRIVEKVGTAFIAAEGASLIHNRFAASLAKDSITDKLPIAWVKELPNFSTLEGINAFIGQLKALDKRFQDDFGVRLGQYTIDTVSATFALKKEDDNAEATATSKIMRRIADETGTVAIGVHHFGKAAESGLRGASAWRGCADVVLAALADVDQLSGKASNRELTCAKSRDGEQGPLSPFELEFIELGIDEDGEPYGSCRVVPVENGASRFDKTKKLSRGARNLQDAIAEAMDSGGAVIVPRAGMPAVRAVKVCEVRAEFDRRYVAADQAKPDAKRMAFKRALDHQLHQYGAGEYQGTDWIWPLT